MIYFSGGQPVRNQEQHFLLSFRKEPHHTHRHTSPHLFLTHTHIFAQLTLLQISHTKMTVTELNKAFIGKHVMWWNFWYLSKSCMKLGKEPHAARPSLKLNTPDILTNHKCCWSFWAT